MVPWDHLRFMGTPGLRLQMLSPFPTLNVFGFNVASTGLMSFVEFSAQRIPQPNGKEKSYLPNT
jgi:hypothetical protein